MAAPAFSKTYGYKFDQRITASTVANENKDTWLAIFAALKGTGLVNFDGSPYTGAVFTCKGSSNGAGAGTNDNTDRLAARADIVHAASGTAHSWWRGRLGTSNLEVLFDFNVVDANAASVLVLISTVGFGAANGGTDGTTTARPTAIDEVAIQSSATTAASVLYTTTGDRLINTQLASDGEIVRVFVRAGGAYRTALEICKAAAPLDASWTKQWFGCSRGGSAVFDTSSVSTTVWFGFKNGGGRFTGGVCVPSLSGSPIMSTVAGASSFNLAYDTYPVFFVGTDAGSQGYRGVMPDAWWVPNNLNDGDTMPQLPSATRTHLVVGNLLVPNDGGTADLA